MELPRRTLRVSVLAGVGILIGSGLGLAVALAAAPPPQDQRQQQPPIFRAGVRAVRVDVSVIGRDDQAVAGLQAADFEVAEDGVPQKVDSVQFVRMDGRPRPDENSLEIRSPEHAEAEAERDDVRLFAFFLDDYHIDRWPSINVPLRRALSNFVNRLQPTDLMVIADPLMPLSALQFTRSKPDLLDTIRKFEGRQGEIFPIKSAVDEAHLQAGDVVRLRAEVTLTALEALTVKLGGLKEGRKSIVFVSQGPPTYLGMGINLQTQLTDVIRAANRGNVTIHVLDPRGLGGQGVGVIDTLYQLANETGGRRILRTNGFDEGLSEVIDDSSAYYLLGYTPSRSDDDGKFHRITVKVRRPGVRVVARQGYWAPSRKELDAAAEAANKPAVPGVSDAMRTLARSTPKGAVQLWVGISRRADGRPTATLTWEPADVSKGGAIAAVEAEVVRAADRVVVAPAKSVPASSPASPGRGRAVLDVPPGDLVVRLTARAADNTVADRWEVPLAVVDFGTAPVALATPRFYTVTSIAELRAVQADPDPVPRASTVFRQTERLFVEVQGYAAASAPVTLTAHLMSASGQELAPIPLPALVDGRARVELPIRSLGRGTYLLRFRASAGTAQTELMVGFRIVP